MAGTLAARIGAGGCVMGKVFPLAGLLRLRRQQQEQAAAELAAAHARLRAASTRRARARAALELSTSSVHDSATLGALAAARASSRSMLADLDALRGRFEEEAGEATRDYTGARLKALPLEKLEAKHDEAARVAELRAEQSVLDELAATAWHRKQQKGDD